MTELAAGVDLGGTKIQTVVASAGKVLGEARLPTPSTSAAEVIAEVTRSILLAVDSAGIRVSDLTAVGVGAPGGVESDTGHVSKSANVAGFLERVPLGPEVSRGLGGIRVNVENDVRAAVTGELRYGAGRAYKDFLGVFVGSGVGGGLVLDGKLRRGRGHSGEIGHTTVRPGGRECGCGRFGCLEAYAGRVSIERRARQHVAKGRKTKLFEIMERKGRDRVTSSVIAEALEQKDALTVELLDKAVAALAVAVANAQNLLDLDAIVLGGGLTDRLGDPFVERVRSEMNPNLRIPEEPPAVLISELGDHAGAIGAAAVAIESSPAVLNGAKSSRGSKASA
jgi:glucokinase